MDYLEQQHHHLVKPTPLDNQQPTPASVRLPTHHSEPPQHSNLQGSEEPPLSLVEDCLEPAAPPHSQEDCSVATIRTTHSEELHQHHLVSLPEQHLPSVNKTTHSEEVLGSEQVRTRMELDTPSSSPPPPRTP